MVIQLNLYVFRTPLMAAAKKGHSETCEFLLKKGADPAFTDAQGTYFITGMIRMTNVLRMDRFVR